MYPIQYMQKKFSVLYFSKNSILKDFGDIKKKTGEKENKAKRKTILKY